MISTQRILILEDSLHDRQLLEETLLSEVPSFQIIHAQTKEEFEAALEKNKFDLIISDFSIPSYSGTAALALSKQIQPDTPFIFVSRTIGEDCAVESLKLGATDYVLKDRPGQLTQAVQRALREAQERIERKGDSHAESEAILPAQKNSIGGNEKILLVEDDPDVRKFVHYVLVHAGYQIQEAANGVEALKVWRKNAMQFDLLLTDIVMPGGISGGKLAEHLCVERPNLKVVFMSGYNPDIAGKMQPPGYFLQKPCSIEVIIETVRNCLGESPQLRES